MRGKVAEAQLLFQALVETFLYGEGVVFRALVIAPVLNGKTIAGDGIVVLHLVKGDVLWLVVIVTVTAV